MQLRVRCCNKSFEQWMRLVRFALEFRMKLRRNEERMIGQLDYFCEFSIRCVAADDKARLLELFAVSVVEFITVTMPLVNAK